MGRGSATAVWGSGPDAPAGGAAGGPGSVRKGSSLETRGSRSDAAHTARPPFAADRPELIPSPSALPEIRLQRRLLPAHRQAHPRLVAGLPHLDLQRLLRRPDVVPC